MDAAQHLKLCEASSVYIIATHGILSGEAMKELDECEAINWVSLVTFPTTPY